MDTFNFVDLYAFLQTALGMVLAFLKQINSKSVPPIAAKPPETARFAVSGAALPGLFLIEFAFGGRRSMKRNEKSRPSSKDCGSNAKTD